MSSDPSQLHVFFLPFMGHGHSIPTVEIARLFSSYGAKTTIITTPVNAPPLQESIDQDIKAGLDIGLQILQFPSVPGLPEGCENIDSVTSPEQIFIFFKAITLLQHQVEELLVKLHPHCIVADMFFPWTTDLSKKHGIPRLVFHGMGSFCHVLTENLKRYAPFNKVTSDTEAFVIPGLPDPIEMTRSQLADHVTSPSKGVMSDVIDLIEETEPKSFGVILNTFYAMEPAYIDFYKNDMGRKAWSIGPVSHYDINSANKAMRGKKSSIDEKFWLDWLNAKEPSSVLYVCFGSAARFSTAQLLEVAAGLEASETPFIWVIKLTTNVDKDQFPPKGFEERMQGKGLIVTKWAPQKLILDHPSVGGFMTHCGWNSLIEGVTAGLPLITWPLFADQFYNEKLVTQVMKTGITAGNGTWGSGIEQVSVTVTKEMVEKAVTKLMKNDTDDMRNRARELGEKGKMAVKEGGSSFTELISLIEELKGLAQQS